MYMKEALIVIPPLTSVVSALAASLEVRNFLLSLRERWVELAGFLGFSEEEVGAITEAHASNTEQQVRIVCQMSQGCDMGTRKTVCYTE